MEYKLHVCPCSTVPLEQLTVVQLVNKFTAFHGTQRLITVITWADSGAHSEPHKSSQFPHTTLHIHFKINLPSITLPSKWCLDLKFSNRNFPWISLLSCACHVLHTQTYLIWPSLKYLLKTHFEAPNHAKFWSPQSPPPPPTRFRSQHVPQHPRICNK